MDAIRAIGEHEAKGQLADLYADIRQTLGVSVVNLIWRHLATVDGALEWAWATVKPVYVSGAAAAEADRLIAGIGLPELPAIPESALFCAGVSGEGRADVDAVLASYNRSNALNLIALTCLAVEPIDMVEVAAPATARTPIRPIPRVPELDEIPLHVRGLVMALNRLGGHPEDRIVASMYKHLSPWPGYLSLAWGLLAPMHQDGSLEAAITATRAAARMHAARIAGRLGTPGPSDTDAFVRAACEEFTERAISRMVPIGLMLGRSMEA